MLGKSRKDPAPGVEAMSPQVQELSKLWLLLAMRNLRSIVLVPADRKESAVEVARSLAEAGLRIRDGEVALLAMTGPQDYAATVRAVTGLSGQQGNGSPPRRLIVAIPSVLSEPLGLGVTHAADGTLLCVRVGKSRAASARRTSELVGRGRIAGCVLIR